MLTNVSTAHSQAGCTPIEPARHACSEPVAITIYENEIPPLAGPEMERLYGSVFSSLAHFATYDSPLSDVHTYVARRGGEIVSVFLFRIRRQRLQVMNEVIHLDEDEIRQFACFVFSRFDRVSVISFHAIRTRIRDFPFPYQQFNCSEDIVLSLPGSEQEYLKRLGRNTRRNIRRYSDKLQHSFPSFEYTVHENEAADEGHIRAIIELNHARMAKKNKESNIDEAETCRIIRQVKQSGMIGVARIDGRVCAGTISFRCGSHHFLSVVAHAPEYDDFWLGVQTSYRAIRECILRGGTEFHFLWGRYDYKYVLLAQKRDLFHVAIYRSAMHRLLNVGTGFKNRIDSHIRHVSLILHRMKGQKSFLARLAIGTFDHLRRTKRMLTGQ